jgi:hypothetical protein
LHAPNNAGQLIDIDQLIALSSDPSTLLLEIRDGDELIQIRECDDLRWAYNGGHALLSAFRPKAPAELVFPHHHSMLCALLLCERPGAVLNLGFGLGSFERYFCAHLAHVKLESVDSSARLVQVSRKWFQIPARWPVIVAAAHKHLHASTAKFDIIFCDIFSGGAHAPCLYDADFYAAAAQRLNSAGVLALNLSPTSDNDLLDILLALRTHFAHVMLSSVSHHGNVVLLASDQRPQNDTELLHRARLRRDSLGMDLRECMQQFTLMAPRDE